MFEKNIANKFDCQFPKIQKTNYVHGASKMGYNVQNCKINKLLSTTLPKPPFFFIKMLQRNLNINFIERDAIEHGLPKTCSKVQKPTKIGIKGKFLVFNFLQFALRLRFP